MSRPRCIPGRVNPLVAALAAALLSLAAPAGAATEELFDRLAEALSYNSPGGGLRFQLSGTLELEGYAFTRPAPGVIQTPGDSLFNPRLSVFVDGQWGPRWYAFAQARADRGFDPAAANPAARLDEYALRFTPWDDARFNVQVGKFATVVGNWAPRHLAWANPFITAPLPYESLTGMWDTESVRSAVVLLQWAHVRRGQADPITAIEKSLRLPIIWGPSYAIGAAISGTAGRFNYALETKQASLSSRPEAWSDGGPAWDHPTVSARVGVRPDPRWSHGISASVGPYLRAGAAEPPAGRAFGRYRQILLGYDLGFAHRQVQLWAEVFATRFAIPAVGNADVLSYYVEAKSKLGPRLFVAGRWNQQFFGRIRDRGGRVPWGHEAWRLDVGPGFRFTPHLQLKFQYSLQRGDAPERDFSHLGAGQLVLRF